MDDKGPVKVFVRKTGLVPGAKTVDLNSLRKIIEKTQNKQLSASRPIKAQPFLKDPKANHVTPEKIRIKPDPEANHDNLSTGGHIAARMNSAGKTSPLKVFIKMEPVERNMSDNTENTLMNTNEVEDDAGLDPPKRQKIAEQEGNETKTDYSCCFCKFSTRGAKEYRTHIAGHLKNKVLNCNSCPFSTAKISAYNDHVRVAHTQKRPPTVFTCSICSFQAPKIESLRRHQSVTGHSDRRPMQKCKLCSYTSRNVCLMLQHISIHKPDEELVKECNCCDNPGTKKPNEGTLHSDKCPEKVFPLVHPYEESLERIKMPKTFTCTLCDFGSEELLFLVEHIKAHAKWAGEGKGDYDSSRDDMPFGCTMCEYRCSKPNKLATHMRTHGPGAVFRCKTCDYETKAMDKFKAHRKLHVGVTAADGDKIFSCFVCLMKFAKQESLQTHMTTHSKQKPFSCHICDYKCVSKLTLLEHLKNHSKQKKTVVFFPCPLCPNKYSTSASLRTHLSNHGTDTKPYQCDFCDYSCYTSELLRVHVQKHSGPNRFRCEICLLSYPSEAKLKEHIRDHLTFDKPLKCDVCCTSFSSRAQLNRHLPIHSGRSDPFVCFACPQSFSSLKSRRNHMRISHKIENEEEWKAQQPIVVRPAGETGKFEHASDKYGYIEEDIAADSDSDEEDVHLGQHQFIGYPAMDIE